MLICTKCNIEYEEGKKFCRNCGSPLVAKAETPRKTEGVAPVEHEKTTGALICPRCQVHYETGKYCRKCGSVLVEEVPFQEKEKPTPIVIPQTEVKKEVPEPQPLEKKSIKGLSKEWLRLSQEKKKLETLMKKLQAQKGAISSDVYNTTFGRYHSQLESISSRLHQIEANLEFVKEKTSEEINLRVKKLTPVKKRLGEVQSLYKAGAITKPDFSRDKNELWKEIRSKESALKKHRHIIALLPTKMGGTVGLSGKEWNFFRPLPLASGGVIILLAAAGYFLWPKYSYLIKKQPQLVGPIPKETITAPATLTPKVQPPSTAPGTELRETERIKSLLEDIRQANLQKNIDLFMSCYAQDFKDRARKKLSTLENWKSFDYLDLSYNLKSQTISGDVATIKVEWKTTASQKGGGQPEESGTTLDVKLKKENGEWKITEIRPVG
jgi:ketosteroid isomerase-like protein